MVRNRQKGIPAGRIEQSPPRKAVPARAAKPEGFQAVPSGLFVVRWNRFDFDGPWCLSRSDPGRIVELMKQIQSVERLHPHEVFNAPNARGRDYGDPAGLPNRDAQRRLRELDLFDETKISRLRFGGPLRLYGFRRDPEFYAVFWDTKHEIWPSAKG